MTEFFIPDEFKASLHYRKMDPLDGSVKLVCPEGCAIDHSKDVRTLFDEFQENLLPWKSTWINARPKKKE